VLKDAKLSLKPADAGWLVFRAAQGIEFSAGAPVKEAEVNKRLKELARVLVRGLRTER
jgi:hypothetical protein